MSDHKPARETRRGKTPADRPTVTDDARAEAMSRYSFGTYHGQMVQWHDAKKLAVDAFIAGAEWAVARAETTAEATERIARQVAATSAMTGRDALELVEAVQALQNAEMTTDLHWSSAAAAEYPGDEYEQYPLRTAFGRGVKWERKRAEANGGSER